MTSIEALDKLVDLINEERDKVADQMIFMQEHKFSHELEYYRDKENTLRSVQSIIRRLRRECETDN